MKNPFRMSIINQRWIWEPSPAVYLMNCQASPLNFSNLHQLHVQTWEMLTCQKLHPSIKLPPPKLPKETWPLRLQMCLINCRTIPLVKLLDAQPALFLRQTKHTPWNLGYHYFYWFIIVFPIIASAADIINIELIYAGDGMGLCSGGSHNQGAYTCILACPNWGNSASGMDI